MRCALLLCLCSEKSLSAFGLDHVCMRSSANVSGPSSCVFSGSAEIIAIAKGTTHDSAGMKPLRFEVSSVDNGSQETTGKGR